jgi:hypothetical protein
VHDALSRSEIPAGAREAASQAQARLYYVPFYELDARLMGQVRLQTGTRKQRGGVMNRDAEGNVSYQDHEGQQISEADYYKVSKVAEYDTRVRMHEIYQELPATRLKGWGLAHVGLKSLRQQGLALRPWDPVAAQTEATVFVPERSTDAVLREFAEARETSAAEWDVELGERRFQVLYLPLWHLRYEFEGRIYALTVSGVDGRLMGGSAPEDHARGLIAMILAGACIGLPVSGILNNLEIIIGAGGLLFNPVGLLMGGSVLLVMLCALAYAWAEFRYRGEVRFEGDQVRVIKLNIPPQTVLDKLVDALAKALDTAFKSARSGYEEGQSW